jgi:hypothetical protein
MVGQCPNLALVYSKYYYVIRSANIFAFAFEDCSFGECELAGFYELMYVLFVYTLALARKLLKLDNPIPWSWSWIK